MSTETNGCSCPTDDTEECRRSRALTMPGLGVTRPHLNNKTYTQRQNERLQRCHSLELNFPPHEFQAALDLSAPATSVLIQSRKNAWIQVTGHAGAFAPAGPNTIWKKRISKDNYEMLTYTALREYPQASYITPIFYREVEYNDEYFIEMEDLLHHFNDPSIMDIKMGTRTFLETEVENPTLRTDLYEKMIKVDSEAPTEEERNQAAITKLRYMQFRDRESSTASLGFRIEAIRMTGEPPSTKLKKVREKEEVAHFVEKFVTGHEVVVPVLHRRLRDIRERFESISFFKSHEVIGSSLLFMYDRDNNAGAWMIDFAKTLPLDGLTVDHRSAWEIGNHEDGYLYGLDNLIEIFDDLETKHFTEKGIEVPEPAIPDPATPEDIQLTS